MSLAKEKLKRNLSILDLVCKNYAIPSIFFFIVIRRNQKRYLFKSNNDLANFARFFNTYLKNTCKKRKNEKILQEIL